MAQFCDELSRSEITSPTRKGVRAFSFWPPNQIQLTWYLVVPSLCGERFRMITGKSHSYRTRTQITLISHSLQTSPRHPVFSTAQDKWVTIWWFYGVMVSTLDFESSDPSSNLGRTFFCDALNFLHPPEL